jgi:hypothetical protein
MRSAMTVGEESEAHRTIQLRDDDFAARNVRVL